MIAHFRHKGLRHLYEEGNAKGVPSAMADKLRKLLFALETAETLEQLGRFPAGGCTLSKATLQDGGA